MTTLEISICLAVLVAIVGGTAIWEHVRRPRRGDPRRRPGYIVDEPPRERYDWRWPER